MSEATIDKLVIEIDGDSANAADNIARLTQQLERLQAAVSPLTRSNSGLDKLAKQLEKLSSISQSLSGLAELDKVAGAANALRSLETLSGKVNITPYVRALNQLAGAQGAVSAISSMPDISAQTNSLVNALRVFEQAQNIRVTPVVNVLSRIPQAAAAIQAMPAVDTARIQSLVDALRPLQNIGDVQGINRAVNALNRLPRVAQQLTSMDMGTFAAQIRELSAALEPLAQQAERAGAGLQAMATLVSRSSSQLSQGNRNYNAFNTTLGNLRTRTIALAASLRRLTNALANCFNVSAQYVENLNLFNVTMKESTDTAMEFAQKVNDALGIDVSDWVRYQGFFQSIASGFGVVSEKADLMSKNLTQLSYDISSFYNVSVEEAYNKVVSGYSGELEPLRRLGFALDEATLKQLAYNKGITQSLESMTQAQKAQLRYVAMIEQAQSIGVTGDMSRTIDSASNGMRVLTARIQQFARAVGNMLMPMLSAMLPYVTAFVQVITEGAQAIADFLGFELPKFDFSSGITGDVEDITGAIDGATEATEKFKGSLAGVDQLNIIGSKNETSAVGAGSQYDLDIELPTYDFLNGVESKTKEIAENIKQWFMDALPWIEAVGGAIAGFTISQGLITGIKAIGTLRTAMSGLSSKIAPVSVALAAGAASGLLFYNAIRKLTKGSGGIPELISGIVVAGGTIAAFIALGNPVGAVITGIAALVGVVAGIASVIKESDDELAALQQTMADTIVYADNGGIAISGLSDGFSDYFDNISSHYEDILENTKAFEDNQKKVMDAAEEIRNLTENYSILGETMTAEDAQQISDNLAIIKNGVSENLGLATKNIIDTLKGKFHELAVQIGIDIDDMVGKFYLLESMGNTSLAALKQNADEVAAKIMSGNYTTEDLSELNDIVQKMSTVDTGTIEQKSFEQALKNMTSADINFESPEALTNALEQVKSAADNARTSVSDAWAAQAKQLDDLQATYINLGVNVEYDATFGKGKFDELFEEYRATMDTGYQQELDNISNSVGVYAGMLYSKLNEYVDSAVFYANPTEGEKSAGFWDEWLGNGLVMSGERAYNRAKDYAEERVRSGYAESFGAISDFAKNYDINISQYEDIGKYLLEGMANGAIENSSDLSNALTIASQDGIEALKEYLGIHSPSKVFYEIGSYMMEGWKNGISENQQSVIAVLDTATINILARLAKLKKEFEQYDIGNMRFAGEADITPTVSFPSSANTGTEPGYAQRNISDMLRNSSGGNGTGETVINLQSQTVVELDGEKLGDAVSNHQYRQVRVTNGR